MTITVIDSTGSTLPGVNVFESNPDGSIISGGFFGNTDIEGKIDVSDVPGYVTFSFVGLSRATFPGGAIPETVQLDSDNSLDTVVITSDSPFPWSTAILISAALIIVLGSLYIYKPSLFKF